MAKTITVQESLNVISSDEECAAVVGDVRNDLENVEEFAADGDYEEGFDALEEVLAELAAVRDYFHSKLP